MQPSYYAVIPATVRYDKSLTPAAKLLYGEITALANTKGYCYASNGYFAELYDVKKPTVSEWISSLQKAGHITIDPGKEAGNERKIYITDPIQKKPNSYSEKTEEVFGKNDIAIPNFPNHNNTVNTKEKKEQECESSTATEKKVSVKKETEAKPESKKKSPGLQFPLFATDLFHTTWVDLIEQPKWKKKSTNALQLSLNKLARYNEEFAIKLMQTTIESGWTGVVFDATDDEWIKFQQRKPTQSSCNAQTEEYQTYDDYLTPEAKERMKNPQPIAHQFSWM